MKTFETPVMSVVTFSVEDVITTSGTDCGSILPEDEL